jgi:hypothetical protein
MRMMLILLISMAVVLTVYGSFYAQEASPKKEVDDVLQFVKEQEPKEVSDSGLYELRAIQYQQKLILLVIIAASTVLFLFLILLFMKFSKTFTATNIVNGGDRLSYNRATHCGDRSTWSNRRLLIRQGHHPDCWRSRSQRGLTRR